LASSSSNKNSFKIESIIGKSKAIKKIKIFIKKVHPVTHSVLITGETGVGKELVSQNIHYLSSRKNKPFIQVNCANIPDNLLESELFGYRKGAFTDARSDKSGLLEEANEGTAFFDEISELPIILQAKLLRVIENQEIRRLGETKTRKIDVRFIFATNADLRKEIIQGRFRKDLYYRISVLKLLVPPLRERKEDIPLLIDHIIKQENIRHKKNKKISKEAVNRLLEYNYPGNIRELNNIIVRAYTFSNKTEIIEGDIIFDEKEAINERKKFTKTTEMIKQALKECKGNKTKAAKKLGVSRMQLYRVLKKL
jgi:transcriptional regulator with PAS, ATPase and Fis domain